MWPNPQLPANLVTLTKETFNGKLNFLWNGYREIFLFKVNSFLSTMNLFSMKGAVRGCSSK